MKLSESGPFSVVYFYCRDLDINRNTFPAVAKAILAQLLQQNREQLLPYLYEECLKSGKVTLTSSQRCTAILNTILDEATKLVIVIDGLDECELKERKTILNFFVSAIERNEAVDPNNPGRLRGLFVSQELSDIKAALHHPEGLRLNDEHTKLDIKKFALKRAISIQQNHQGLTDAAKDHIVKLVCEGSDGMFLFAKLVLDNLFHQENLENVYKEMRPDTFPRGFDQA